MKISVILIVLLLVNTSAILAETIGRFLTGINTWMLILIEAGLVISYYINNVIKDVQKVADIDMTNLNLFVTKNKKSA